MNTPWLKLALFSLVLAPGCFSDNADFCDQDDQCGESQVCNTASNTCEAALAGADAGAPEVEEEVCADTCLSSAPEGWTGPVARADAAMGDTLASCGEVFSNDLGVMNSDIIELGSCDCECGDATGLSCTNGFLREWTTNSESACELNSCDIINGSCFDITQTIFPNTCMEISSAVRDDPFLRATFGNLRGGSCSAPSVSGELSSAFGSQTRLCGLPANSTGCESGEVCAPEAAEDFAEGLCIVQEGEHECPIASGYTERTLLFTGIDDQRSCDTGSCSCDAPTGSCGGKFEFYNGGVNDLCIGALATLQNGTGPFANNGNLCQAIPANATTTAYVIDLEGRDCQQNGSPATNGESVGTGTSTVCCMP